MATVLITGASSGIGEALSHEFARHGYRVLLCARSREKLERLAVCLRAMHGVEAVVLPADLTHKNAPRHLYERVEELGLEVDILVNNAGFGFGGPFVRNRPGLQERMLRLNIFAPTRLCRLFLPGMIAREKGGILNLCSTASFAPGPMNSIYGACKAYLLSLSQALAREAAPYGVRVTALCPGATRTNFARNAHMETTRLFRYCVMGPQQVAKAGYRALGENRRVEVVGLANKLMIGCMRFVPREAVVLVSGWLQQPGAVKK